MTNTTRSSSKIPEKTMKDQNRLYKKTIKDQKIKIRQLEKKIEAFETPKPKKKKTKCPKTTADISKVEAKKIDLKQRMKEQFSGKRNEKDEA